MSRMMNDFFPPLRPARRPPTSVSLGLLLAAEVERRRILLLRYPWESAIALVVFAVMFMVFAAIGSLSSEQLNLFGGNLESLAILYILWTMSISSISTGASQIGTDAATGVLENMFLSTAPIVTVLQVRAMVQALHGVVLGAVLLLAFCVGTGWLPSLTVVATLVVAGAACCATAVGLAMVFAGVALLSKRATMLALPVNFLCIVAMTTRHAPSFEHLGNPLLYLPFVAAATAVRSAVEGGRLDLMGCGIGLAIAVPSLLLGRLVLARCAMACRRAGTTSVY